MFANRMRQQVKAAEAIARESEQRNIKTCHLNTRLEFMQNIETSLKEEKAVDSAKKQVRSPAKRLVSQDESIQKRILSGDGEASFFKKNNPENDKKAFFICKIIYNEMKKKIFDKYFFDSLESNII